MATVIGLKLDGRRDIVAEALQDPQSLIAGQPLYVRRALLMTRKGGACQVTPWTDAGDPEQPIYIRPDQVIGMHSPRKDALTRFKRYWDQRHPTTGAHALPAVGIADLCDLSQPIVVREPSFRPGNVSAVELVVINHLVRRIEPLRCFEIGTFDGRTTLNIACNAPADVRIHTLDLPPAQIGDTRFAVEDNERQFIEKEGSGTRFRGTGLEDKIVQLYGDSATFDFTAFRGEVDFVFVDGSHAKDYVLSDADTAMQLLRRGQDGRPHGLVLFHDYGEWEGVTEALEGLRTSDPGYAGLKHIEDTTLAILDLT